MNSIDYSNQVLNQLSQGNGVFQAPPLVEIQKRNAGTIMRAIVTQRLAFGGAPVDTQKGSQYAWNGGIILNRNSRVGVGFWTNIPSSQITSLQQVMARKNAVFLFCHFDIEKGLLHAWAVPDSVTFKSIVTIPDGQSGLKTLYIEVEKHRFKQASYSPDLAPFYRLLVLTQTERDSLTSGIKQDLAAKELANAMDPDEDEDEGYAGEEIEGRNYWLLAPGQGAVLWDAWYDQGIGGIGWNDLGDLNDYESKEAVVDYVPQFYPDAGPAAVANMLWEFAQVMKVGDIVFAKLGLHKVCGWGVVSGDYEFADESEPFHHLRKIEWQDATELSMPTGVQLPLKTLTRMTTKRQFLDYLARNYDGVPGLEASGDAETDNSGEGRIAGEPYDLACALEDLFMPPSQVQACIELLKRKKNVILQGAPGTGKTFVAKRLAYLLMERKDNSRVQMVQFHQSLTYEDFVQGYKPSADGGFRLENGTFHKFVTAALSKPKIPFVFVIDEINRGNLSKVFGELMMLIEHDKRSSEFALPLSYCSDPEATFYVPENVYLIGTMNTADRSLSMVDYALRRRFSFVELVPGFESQAFADCLVAAGASNALITNIRKRMNLLNGMISSDETNLGRGYQIGHSYFVPSEGQLANQQWLDHILVYEIKPLVEEYYCDDQVQRTAALEILFGVA